MTTIKSYTDIEQSRKLAEILPIESADMQWIKMSEDDDPDTYRVGVLVNPELIDEDDIPCWSLAALLDILPNKLQIVLAINDFQGYRKEKYVVGSVECDNYDCYADNPVDACYELILKLHELKNKELWQ